MPTYEITAPNGQIYEVTAPEGVSEQDVLLYAQQNYSAPQGTPQPAQPTQELPKKDYSGISGASKSFGAGALDMATFGLSDEIKAGIAAGTLGAYNLFNDTGVSVKEGYTQSLEQLRNEQKQMQEQQGGAYLGGQLAGALLPMGAAAKGGMTIGKGAGIGAVQGALYGAGSGEGGETERLQSAAVGGAFGASGGAGGVLAGRQLSKLSQSKPVKSMAERAKALFSKAPQNVQANISSQAAQQPIGVEKQLNTLSKGGNDVFSMTVGQKTQLPKPQRLEAEALAGIYGDDAERAVRLAQTAQSRERKAFISQLGDVDKIGDSGDVLEDVFSAIKSQSKKLKGQVNNAYDLAREGGGTRISVDDIKDGLFSNIIDIKRQNKYDLTDMTKVKPVLKDLTRMMRSSKGVKFTKSTLDNMEAWRTRVTNAANDAPKGSTEARFLNQIRQSYDDFMYKTANEAVDQNDQAAIMAFRDAVSKRREYGQLYETNKFVKDLVEGKKDIDDAVKDLIGTGSIVGKKRMESTFDAIVKAGGTKGDLVKADLQTAFAKKLLDQSIEGMETGAENAYLSAAKTKKALEGLFINNRNFAKKLYGEQAVTVARQAISELDKIAKTQAATQNPSGSGQLVMRQLMRLPMLSTLKEGVNFAIVKPMKAGQVSKSVDPVVNTIQNMKVTPQSNIWAKAGGKLMAEQGVNK